MVDFPHTSRHLARRILEAELDGANGPISITDCLSSAFEHLRVYLSKRFGSEGYRLLLSRSLQLARAECTSPADVRVGADGTLISLDGIVSHPPTEPACGEVALITSFLELLETFIGQELCARFVDDLWHIKFTHGDSIEGNSNG